MKTDALQQEDISRMSRRMEDPGFMDLISEYAKDIADPKIRAETEELFARLEANGQVQEVYGKNVQLLVLEPGLVLKTHTADSQEKVFINVCTCDKVAQAKAWRPDPQFQKASNGTHWDVPYALGQKAKEGTDAHGAACTVYDIAVHPETRSMADKDARFQAIVAETAIEAVEKSGGRALRREHRVLNMRYKATLGCDRPATLCMRGGPAGAQPAPTQACQQQPATSNKRSGFSFPTARPREECACAGAGHQEEEPPQAANEVVPEHTVIESLRAANSGEVGRDELLILQGFRIRVKLPGVRGSTAIDLQPATHGCTLRVPGRYRLIVQLRCQVNFFAGHAYFDAVKEQLEISMPIVART